MSKISNIFELVFILLPPQFPQHQKKEKSLWKNHFKLIIYLFIETIYI